MAWKRSCWWNVLLVLWLLPLVRAALVVCFLDAFFAGAVLTAHSPAGPWQQAGQGRVEGSCVLLSKTSCIVVLSKAHCVVFLAETSWVVILTKASCIAVHTIASHAVVLTKTFLYILFAKPSVEVFLTEIFATSTTHGSLPTGLSQFHQGPLFTRPRSEWPLPDPSYLGY